MLEDVNCNGKIEQREIRNPSLRGDIHIFLYKVVMGGLRK